MTRADEQAHEQVHRQKMAMARGYVVLDENLRGLAPALRARNIRVIEPPSGTSDEDIKERFLPGRIFITNNAKDFEEDVSSFEFGLIAVQTSFIDSMPGAGNKTVKAISDAIQRHGLWALQRGFVVTVNDNGSTFTPKLD
ncbi:MAG: hypothetical protein HY791_22490 [Deltaproteobacteria bacterium]|nr:hypothetical protein [Deltaproteobacteria bacterium]